MGAWLETYEKLSPEQQDRVQRWLHLNKFISRTLRIDWEKWVEEYLTPAMERPMDYSFMEPCLPGFSGLDTEGAGVAFSRDVDPATAQTARVPLRAKNNLGRLSPDVQDQIAGLLSGDREEAVALPPSDVALLQKIFPKEKALAKLKRKDFRSVRVMRVDEEIVLSTNDDELLRESVIEFGATMRKAYV